jgi:flagellar protein FliO/FliZ
MEGAVIQLFAGVGEAPELAPTGYGMALFKMLAALVVVCALAYLLLRLAQRHLGARARGGVVRVVDRCPLAGRQSLWVVEVAGRFFLIGTTDGSITKLAELEGDRIPDLERSRSQRSFWELLKGKGAGPEGPDKEGR